MAKVIAGVALLAGLTALAILFGPAVNELSVLHARISVLEGKKCTLMVVLTPSGQATICAVRLIADNE